jgi:hypothetical protein
MQLFDLACVVDKQGTQDGGEKMEEQKGFDINTIVEELDKEFATEAEDQLEESVEEPEEELEEEVLDDEEEVLEEEEVDETPEEKLNDDDVHKRNEAFKQLRKERDQLAQSDKFLADLAQQYGLTKEQLMIRFQEDQIKRQAKEQGVPEEQLRKMQQMEKRLQEVEESKQREVFNIKAESLVAKYSLTEKEMTLIFQEAGRMGLDIIRNPDLLEFAYRAVNYDNAVNQGRQKQLETTKKRSKTSTGKTGTQGREPVVTDDDQWEREIDSLLKDLNL